LAAFFGLASLAFGRALPSPTLLPVTASARVSASASTTLPVICYHRFGSEDDFDELKISGRRFGQELAWLKKAGYETISLQQASDFFSGKFEGLPEHPIILSMDDGYRSTWKIAGPLLKRYGFKAVYFLISSQVGAGKNFLTWADVRELLAAGHEVGSHSVKHSNLAKPGRNEGPVAYAQRLRREVVESKKILQEKLGLPVRSLAYPLGAYNPTVEAVAVKAGYDLIFTVTAAANLSTEDPHRIHRFIIMSHPSLESFKKKVSEQRLQAPLEGLSEGVGFYARELPRELLLKAPPGWDPQDSPRVELQGERMELARDEERGGWSFSLKKKMKPGFYFLKIEAGQSKLLRHDSYLFQIYANAWTKWFDPIKEPHDDTVKQ
jgi:peptidoglycan/xylan/chitin deacetylase (PgdA/CDA1 family)